MSDDNTVKTMLQRMQAIEDRLAIYNLLASQPPTVESGDKMLHVRLFTEDGVLDRGNLGVTSAKELGENFEKVGMPEALLAGLAHLCGLPYVALRADDTALAISYILTLMPDPTAEEIALPAHGKGRGHRVLRVIVNRWELRKIAGRWKIARRVLRLHNGSGVATTLLRETLAEMLAIEEGNGVGERRSDGTAPLV